MSYEKLFALKEDILKVAGSEDLLQDLNRAVEEIIARCDDGKMNRSFRLEIIGLISSIEPPSPFAAMGHGNSER